MAASDSLNSIDDMLKAAREQHARETKDISDQLFAAQVELKLTQEALTKQQDRTATAERFAVKLIAQFATVNAALSLANQAFEDAKALALQSSTDDKSPNTKPGTGNRDDGQPRYVAPPPGTPVPPPWKGVDQPQGQGIDPDAPHG